MGSTVKDFASLTYTEYYTLFCLAKYDAAQDHRINYYIEQPNTDNSPAMHVILCTPLSRRLPQNLVCLRMRRKQSMP